MKPPAVLSRRERRAVPVSGEKFSPHLPKFVLFSSIFFAFLVDVSIFSTDRLVVAFRFRKPCSVCRAHARADMKEEDGMEAHFWEYWYSDAEFFIFLGAVIVFISLWPALDSFINFIQKFVIYYKRKNETNPIPKPNFLKDCIFTLDGIKSIFLILMCFGCYIVYTNIKQSPEINYQNALKFRYGNNGFPINDDLALIAFRRAAEGNHKEACRDAGDMLEARGDTLEAVKMWVKAVKLGDAGAARQLGDFYARGNFQNLTEVERLNSAYLAYYEGVCLGDATLQKEVDRLRQQVSWQTHRDAMEKCAALRKHLGRRG